MAESNNHRSISGPRILALTVTLIVVGLFAVYVWPTRYRYDHITYPSGMGTYPIRIDRFSGEVEVLRSGGWLRIAGSPNVTATPTP